LNTNNVFEILPINWDILLLGMQINDRRLLSLPNCFLNKKKWNGWINDKTQAIKQQLSKKGI
jgi:hypothetical protein